MSIAHRITALRDKFRTAFDRGVGRLFGRTLLGIDIGHRAIKGVQLARRGKKVYLQRYFYTDMATVFPKFPEEADPQQVLTAMAQMHELSGARTASALADDQVFNFEISLPQMPRSELAQAVQFEVSNLSRIPEGELVVDYWTENQGQTKPGENLRIRAFAARSEHIQSHLERLSQASLRPLAIESVMLANVEALRYNGYVGPRTQCAIVDLGDSETVVAFVRQGSLHYCRSEKTGSGAFNQALQGRLAISYGEAEKTKLSLGVESPEPPLDPAVQETLEAVNSRIFRAIKDAVEGYLENTPDTQLEAVYLVGGGSSAPRLTETIQGILGVPVVLANPFKNIEPYPDPVAARDSQVAALAPQLTTAVGLALRGIEP